MKAFSREDFKHEIRSINNQNWTFIACACFAMASVVLFAIIGENLQKRFYLTLTAIGF